MPCASASLSLACRAFASAPRHYQLSNYPKAGLYLDFSKNSLPLPLPRRPLCVAFARRKNTNSLASSKDKKRIIQKKDGEEDDLDEDAFEAFFNQLEEDLKNDDLSADDWDGELTEEDLVKLEQELEEALGSEYEDELSGILESHDGNLKSKFEEKEEEEEEEKEEEEEDDEEEEEEEEEEEPVKLKTWQLRRLASALKIGRRKISIKNLAAELGLDRALVLELLRDPPPNLLLMSVSLPDEVTENPVDQEKDDALKTPTKPVEVREPEHVAEPKSEVKSPIHIMVNRWSTQKRLKKVQIETLERVYDRSKRPTNSMIKSIVDVTNLPRKTVVKWFEEKRLQDGVPERRLPYSRSMAGRSSNE